LRLYLIGVRNLVVETDARYIKGMLSNPDIQPSASINRWIVSILTFHFTLEHVKGVVHGPDGLSCHPKQTGNPEEDEDEEFDDWIDKVHGFIHIIQLPACIQPSVLVLALTWSEPTEHTPNTVGPPLVNKDDDYTQVPRNPSVIAEDEQLDLVWLWMDMLK
jgi:hypothetical protein